MKSTNISEIETFSGWYRGDNVLEGFRANTEQLCNEKPEALDTHFSEDFRSRCIEDMIIINELSEDEPLKIPHITVEQLKEIVSKKTQV